LLFVWLVMHRQRVLAMQDALEDKGLDYALAQRRSEGDL
jgi:heme exporter protein C